MTLSKINKENINSILNNFAKNYKKLCGNFPSEIVIVGGASIVINYGFRESTQDIDVLYKAASGVKDAILKTAEELSLPEDWMNSDFEFLSSFSSKLYEVSKPYRMLNNNSLSIRTVKAEYLIAMKMKSGRLFGNDLPDIVGIIRAEKIAGNGRLCYEVIVKAVEYLYGNVESINVDILNEVKGYCELTPDELVRKYNSMVGISNEIKERICIADEIPKNKESVKKIAEEFFSNFIKEDDGDYDDL